MHNAGEALINVKNIYTLCRARKPATWHMALIVIRTSSQIPTQWHTQAQCTAKSGHTGTTYMRTNTRTHCTAVTVTGYSQSKRPHRPEL